MVLPPAARAASPCWVPRAAPRHPERRPGLRSHLSLPAPSRCWEKPPSRGRRPPGRVRPARPVRRLPPRSPPRKRMFPLSPRRPRPRPRHPVCLRPRRRPHHHPPFPRPPSLVRPSLSRRPRRLFPPRQLRILRHPRCPRLSLPCRRRLPLADLLQRRPLRPRLSQRLRRLPRPLRQPHSRRQRPSRWRSPLWRRLRQRRMRQPSKVLSWLRRHRQLRKAGS